MHILFLYSQQNTILLQKPLRGQEEISFDISYIAAVLEQESHTCELVVLNSNHDILVAVQKVRENNIGVGIFNLIGLPQETEVDYQATLQLNQQIQPDWHATSIFFPYPGTDLYDRVRAMGLMPANLPGKDERQMARISYPDFSKCPTEWCT